MIKRPTDMRRRMDDIFDMVLVGVCSKHKICKYRVTCIYGVIVESNTSRVYICKLDLSLKKYSMQFCFSTKDTE